MTGDLRINDVPELRSRFKSDAADEDMTYEEFLTQLLTFYENNREQFRQASLVRDRER